MDRPRTPRRFVCYKCGEAELVAGGTARFQCSKCRVRTPADIAHVAVGRAVRRGELERPANFPCADCGGPATEYDHRDYQKPLEVEPVCRRCNLLRGPALNSKVTTPSDRQRIKLQAHIAAMFWVEFPDQPKPANPYTEDEQRQTWRASFERTLLEQSARAVA